MEVKGLPKEEAEVKFHRVSSICLQTLLGMLTDPCDRNLNQEGDHQAHHCFHNNDDGDAAITCCWCGSTFYDDKTMWRHTRRELREPAGASEWIN